MLRTSFFIITQRLTAFLVGAIVFFIVLSVANLTDLGFYFSALNFAALIIFFELGATASIIPSINQEQSSGYQIESKTNTKSLKKISGIYNYYFSYFNKVFYFSIFSLPLIGIIFFKIFSISDFFHMGIPWLILIFSYCYGVKLNFKFIILESFDLMEYVAKIRIIQHILSIVFLLFFFNRENFLFVISIYHFLIVLIGSISVNYKYKYLFNKLKSTNHDKTPVSYKIRNFRKKISISWIFGYFAYQLFNPFLYHFHGAAESGMFGMIIYINNFFSSISSSFAHAIYPKMSRLNSNKQSSVSIFKKSFVSSVSLYLLILVLSLYIIYLFPYEITYLNMIKEKLPPFFIFAITLFAGFIIFVISLFAYYVRSYVDEPFMFLSIASGLSTLILVILFIPFYGITAASFIYFFVSLIIAFPLSLIILCKKLKHDN